MFKYLYDDAVDISVKEEWYYETEIMITQGEKYTDK